MVRSSHGQGRPRPDDRVKLFFACFITYIDMTPRPRARSIHSSARDSPSTSNLNAQYRSIVQTAQAENRNSNPYDNSYTFTARGSQKVAAKVRKFIKTALLVGGAAGLAYFFRGQIGSQITPILESLGGQYKALKQNSWNTYAALKGNAVTKYEAAKLNAKSNKPGFAGRTMQGWQSTSRSIGRARAGVAMKYGKARAGVTTTYGKARNGIRSKFANLKGSRTRPINVNAALHNHAVRRVQRASVPGPLTEAQFQKEYSEQMQNKLLSFIMDSEKRQKQLKRRNELGLKARTAVQIYTPN